MLKQAYDTGYQAAFDKVAAPRWIKELGREALSPDSQSTLRSLKLPTRTIKPLGEGASQIADLVHHPEHGLSVRKLPRVFENGGTSSEMRAGYAAEDYANWGRVKEITGGQGPFAHILGSEGPAGYFQYVKPVEGDTGSVLQKQLTDLRRKEQTHRERADKLSDADFTGAQAEHNLAEELNRQAYGVADKLQFDRVQFPPDAQASINKVRAEFPGFDDYDVHRNVRGGKIVDAGFGSTTRTTMGMRPGGDVPRWTRKHWLGKKGS